VAQLRAEALCCSVRAHGEHGAIVRALTRDAGLVSGYVRGGRSRAMRPVLMPGNRIALELRARTEGQLAGVTAELVTSRAPLLEEPLAAAGIDWATVLTAATLPEAQPYPQLFDGLAALLDAIAAAPAARGWAGALARYELLLLAELGFGLALEECVVTGVRTELDFVSPKSGGAVSRAAAIGLEARLLPLPAFLVRGGTAELPDVLAALRLTGHFVEASLLAGRRDALGETRQRLVERLERAVA
jgi:DNA repair protein RecO (recombination protein O)